MGYYDMRISSAFAKAPVIDCRSYPGTVLFSDCHRGTGTWNDSFLNNKILYQAALDYYWKAGFMYIEAGDGDELWENRRIKEIYEVHSDVFEMLDRFQKCGRLLMLTGNHDNQKIRKQGKNKKKDDTGSDCFDFPYFESVIISIKGKMMHVIHGHQADFFNDRLWQAARWMVRYVWKPLELSGFKDPTSAAKNYKKGTVVEERLIGWARKNRQNIIAGHTHRPALISEEGIIYLNTGSCIHPNGITCIEITDKNVQLIKWTKCVDENRRIYVCRQVIGEMNF